VHHTGSCAGRKKEKAVMKKYQKCVSLYLKLASIIASGREWDTE